MLVSLLPDEPDAEGLPALILLSNAHRSTRTDTKSNLVLLADQDRAQ